MPAFAPRYDPRIVNAIRAFDDRTVPIAEVCRRVGRAAEALGLPRPSYVHVRRLVHAHRAAEDAERARKAALRAIAEDAATRVLLGRYVDVYALARQIREAG
jgi:putative intracellular protease/amidase